MLKNGQFGRGCQVEKRPNSAVICHVRPCENDIEEGEKIFPTESHLSRESTRFLITDAGRAGVQDPESRDQFEGITTSRPEPKRSGFGADKKKKIITDGFAAAETLIAVPVTKNFKAEMSMVEQVSRTTKVIKTAIKTTPSTIATTTAATKKAESVCKDTFKRAYCSVILRIGFCKFTTYRKRCCLSCEKSSIR